MTKEITSETLTALEKAFAHSPINKLAENAVARNGVYNAAFNNEALRKLDRKFNIEVKSIGSVTNQKQSGRCWMFSGLNVLRPLAMKKLKVKDLELSESYLMFYDKLEKSNFQLEAVIEHLDEPDDSRLLNFIVNTGGKQDGGYWSFFANLVKKYGVVPKAAQPETLPSSASGEMDSLLGRLMAKYTAQLRNDYKAGKSVDELRQEKEGFLTEIYKVLAICLGQPVKQFTFEYHEDAPGEPEEKTGEKKVATFQRLTCTPKEFFDQYIGANLDDYVSLINFPGKEYQLNRKYTIKLTGNIVGGELETNVNVEIDDLKQAIIASLKADEPVWFACDVASLSLRKEGFLAADLLNLADLFTTDISLKKDEQLIYGAAQVNHAMTLTGVNLDDKGQPVRWKVQNSWGEEVGEKGYFVMDEAWFDTLVYEAVVNKKYLSAAALKVAESQAEEMPPWAPFSLSIK